MAKIINASVVFFLSFFILTHIQGQDMREFRVWQDGQSVEFSNSDLKEAVMYIYSPKKESNKGVAIVVCPGGSYQNHAMNHEGHDVAQWLASEGITGVVLKYRLPKGNNKIPISDLRETTKYLRKLSKEFSLNPNKIGVMGFSAGGHLASTHLTHYVDSMSRPDFGVLFYPVITTDKRYTHEPSFNNLLGEFSSQKELNAFSNENNITSETPPTLLFHSDNDRVHPMNSILFFEGLKKKNIPAAIYIFPSGGHGWGFRKEFAYHNIWKGLLMEWITELDD